MKKLTHKLAYLSILFIGVAMADIPKDTKLKLVTDNVPPTVFSVSRSNTSNTPTLTFMFGEEGSLQFNADGTIVLSGGVKPDKAALEFLKVLRQLYPAFLIGAGCSSELRH